MGKPVVHFEVTGKDARKLQDFYAGLFDWKIDADNHMGYGVVDTEANDRGIAGGIASSPDGSSRLTFYVEVEDLDVYLKKAESMGGKTIAPPMDIPGEVSFALLADPEGHVVGIVKDTVPSG